MKEHQPFQPVRVDVDSIACEKTRNEIHLLMSEYDNARITETNAANAVVAANAELSVARGNRGLLKIRIVQAFAKEVDKVAMEANWEPFRGPDGKPTVENLMSERDLRNLNRIQRAAANTQAKEVTGDSSNLRGMFEGDEE